MLETFVYRCADQITVISEGYRLHVVSKGIDPSKVALIPNWSSVLDVTPSKDNCFRKETNLVGKFLVTYAGTMSWPQDLATIVEAANLMQDYEDIVFVLIGDGVQQESLQKRAEQLRLKNVVFMPLQNRKRYFEIINETDVCVVPLKQSYTSPTAPSKMLDIMVCGKPILANVPADSEVSHLIKRANCGLDITPEAPEVFKEAVLKLHSDKNLRKLLGDCGKKFVTECLSLKGSIDRYEDLLLNLVSK